MDENRTKAIFLLRKNRTSLVWSGVSTFENNPATLPATQTILEGFSVPGLTLTELEQIKNLGKGVSPLVDLLTTEEFAFNQDTACKIHNVVGREEALTWGKFRNDTVGIQNIDYTPPGPDKLPQIWHKAGLERSMTQCISSSLTILVSLRKHQNTIACK